MNERSHLPAVGITMGDPAGIGPEIIARALADTELHSICRLIVFGDQRVIANAMDAIGIVTRIQVRNSRMPCPAGAIPELVAVSDIDPAAVMPAQPTAASSAAMAEAVIEAVRHACAGTLDAVVTAPINKLALQQAGHPYPGHTEMLAHLTGTRDAVMMLAGAQLRVVPVTIHCALAEVARRLSVEGIVKTAAITHASLQHFFMPGTIPRIAIAALNPHAGEGGLFGHEEHTIIAPAIEQLRSQGLDVSGPHPPDTVFHAAVSGRYDAVVCMYHDQGLIPLKLLHFDDGVNITLGLPIIRTSVDHGTAYDIAGKGRASAASLVNAIKTAVAMARTACVTSQA